MSLPKRYVEFLARYPEIGKAYQALGQAAQEAGPLSAREAQLVKLGISIGMRQEGAVHAHTRRALEMGYTPDALRHAALLAVTTMGFPSMMAALSWVEDVIRAQEEEVPEG